MNPSAAARDRARFNDIFTRLAGSRTLSSIWREVYGAEYPEEATPFSFVTVTELRSLGSRLRLSSGQRLADLACGQGGPSLFVAAQTGATVIGIDASQVAVHAATAVAVASAVAHTAKFIVADAAAMPLRSVSLDGVMSIDALQLMRDRSAVLAEVGRILRPGGRFVFTTWVSREPGTRPPFPVDYQPLLESAGLEQELCFEPPDWERRESAVFATIRERAADVRGDLGDAVAAMIDAEAATMRQVLPLIRRVNVVSRKAE